MSAYKSGYPSTAKSAPTTTNFSKGLNTYLPNDVLEYEQVRIAQNVRFDRIGEYKTRTGLKALMDPIGTSTTNYGSIDSSPYTLEDTLGKLIRPGTPAGSSKYYSITVYLQPTSPSVDGDVIEMKAWKHTPSGSSPDKLLGTACARVNSDSLTAYTFTFPFGLYDWSGQALETVFTIDSQDTPGTNYKIAMIEYAADDLRPISIIKTAPYGRITGLFEANLTLAFNGRTETFILFSVVTSGISPTIYALNPDGTVSTLFTALGTSYGVRFSQNGNEVRVAYGEGGPKKLTANRNFSNYLWTVSDITTTDLQTGTDLQIKTSNILTGTQDNIIYFDYDTNTQAVWTNPYGLQWAPGVDYTTSASINPYVVGTTTTTSIAKSTLEATNEDHLVSAITTGDIVMDGNDNYGEVTAISSSNVTVTSISHVATPINSYDKFDRDFRQNFPAIKTGDPLTAMINLGGVVFFFTRRHKYYMISQSADVWTQQASPAQHGTFSQESVACDLNYAYFASDDGVYRFNGSSEESLTDKTVQNLYDKIQKKDQIKVALYNNRLYVFYSSGTVPVYEGATATMNDRCLVYNINLKVWESLDTNIPVSMAIGRQTLSNRLICGSNAFGQLMEYDSYEVPDDETGDQYYADLGSAPINMDIATSYLHFGTPSQLHRISKWRPEFGTSYHNYKVRCGYALDFTDQVKYAFSIDLKDHTNWNEHLSEQDWNTSGVVMTGASTTPTKLTTIPKVYNQFRRCQIRYQHHAAFEPVSFKSHTLCVETQRIR